METKKCPQCALVNWSTSAVCLRCGVLFTNYSAEGFSGGDKKAPEASFSAVSDDIDDDSPEAVKQSAWKKVKWGSILSVIGIAITIGAFNLGIFEGDGYFKKVKLFSLLALLPPAFVLAGGIELITGVPISDLIEKWEKLPQWLGWLIGIVVFLTILVGIITVVAVVLFNFF